jgi:adenosylcobinamide kinase/adenosylcobinamide-phosphate guanylyltransferase
MNPTIRSQWSANIFTFPKLTLVLGGAASGKSAFAEGLASRSGLPRSYLATAQAFDDEMRTKILKHKADRGPDWTTTEVPIALPEVLKQMPCGNVVLVDCLTLWLTNLMLAENGPTDPAALFLDAASTIQAPIVTVSNEVGHGIIPESRLGRRFQTAQGQLNQKIAAHADLVVLVTAGIPQVLKGQLPETRI